MNQRLKIKVTNNFQTSNFGENSFGAFVIRQQIRDKKEA